MARGTPVRLCRTCCSNRSYNESIMARENRPRIHETQPVHEPFLIDLQLFGGLQILVPEGTSMSALTVQVLRLSLSLGSVTAVNLRRSVCGAQGSLDR